MPTNGEVNQTYKQTTEEKDQDPNTGGGAVDSSGGAAAPASGSRVATSSNGQQAGSTGSGRFTNLQKYIGANQGAGDRLGAGITNKVSRENEGASKEANTSAGAVRDGIVSAQNKLVTGKGYQDAIESKDFDAQNFLAPTNDISKFKQDVADNRSQFVPTGRNEQQNSSVSGSGQATPQGSNPPPPASPYDQNKLQDFTNFRTGSAIDEAQLAKQNQAAQTNYMNLQNQMQNQLGQTQTENGRFNMLKNTFGGGSVYQNPYTQGQQRLDGLFLQSGGGNQIGQLQNNLRSGVSAAGQQLGQLDASGKVIGDIATQEGALATGLQSGIDAKTGKYVTDIEGTAGAVNAQRQADQDYYNKQYNALTSGGAVGQRFADAMGIGQGQNLYNSLNSKNVNEFFKYGNTNLTGFGQLADSKQENYYNALNALGGKDSQFVLDGNPEAAAQFIGGSFDDEKAANNNITNDLRGRTANSTNNWTLAGANGQVGVGSVMDQLAADQNLDYNNLTAQNNYAGFGTGIDPTMRNYGNTLNSQTQQFLDRLRPSFSAQGVYNNATHYRDETMQGTVAGAKSQALMQALQQLQDVNYFNRVKINPDDTESGGNFGVK